LQHCGSSKNKFEKRSKKVRKKVQKKFEKKLLKITNCWREGRERREGGGEGGGVGGEL
jgi:hypothetical protein